LEYVGYGREVCNGIALGDDDKQQLSEGDCICIGEVSMVGDDGVAVVVAARCVERDEEEEEYPDERPDECLEFRRLEYKAEY